MGLGVFSAFLRTMIDYSRNTNRPYRLQINTSSTLFWVQVFYLRNTREFDRLFKKTRNPERIFLHEKTFYFWHLLMLRAHHIFLQPSVCWSLKFRLVPVPKIAPQVMRNRLLPWSLVCELHLPSPAGSRKRCVALYRRACP